ncbi:MAG: phage holin family protein [Candidatus Paceibacterota bacterium]
MMNLLSHWLLAAVSIGIAAAIIPGVQVTLVGALIAAVVLGALNFFLRPFLLVLTLPITIFTLGLFSIVINAVLVLLASAIVPGFAVGDFWTALLFALALAIVNWVFHLWRNSDDN